MFVCTVLIIVWFLACLSSSHVLRQQNHQRWLQLQDQHLSLREEGGVKEKAIWVRCPNSTPVEIFRVTPRSSTGQSEKLHTYRVWGFKTVCLRVHCTEYFLISQSCMQNENKSKCPPPPLGSLPRMPLRRCVLVTSAGSWRRGSV